MEPGATRGPCMVDVPVTIDSWSKGPANWWGMYCLKNKV